MLSQDRQNQAGQCFEGCRARLAFSFLDVAMYAGLTIDGTVGTQYRIDCSDDIGPVLPLWHTLTNIVLPHSPFTFTDYSSRYSPSRFYRAVSDACP